MKYELVKDRIHPGDWRVEAVDAEHEGVVYVALFTGPKAKERATEYAEWKGPAMKPNAERIPLGTICGCGHTTGCCCSKCEQCSADPHDAAAEAEERWSPEKLAAYRAWWDAPDPLGMRYGRIPVADWEYGYNSGRRDGHVASATQAEAVQQAIAPYLAEARDEGFAAGTQAANRVTEDLLELTRQQAAAAERERIVTLIAADKRQLFVHSPQEMASIIRALDRAAADHLAERGT